MKAVTIKQPFASLICTPRKDNPCLGIKDIENRMWSTKFRGTILVHSSMKPVNRDWLLAYATDELKLPDQIIDLIQSTHFVCGAIIGSIDIVDCVINHNSIWAEQTDNIVANFNNPIYNWVLANPVLFKEPIPAKGHLSFWNFELK